MERPIPYVRDSFFAGRDFASLQAMREAAATWCREVAGRRDCRPLGGARPLDVFTAREAGELLPLPVQPFELATWSRPKVHADCHVSVEGALYSVPWRYIGEHVDARCGRQLVEMFVSGELVKTHRRVSRGRKSTDWNDYPPEKVAFLQRTPAWCRQRAREAGEHVGRLVNELLAGNALHHLRAAQGVLRLGDQHGRERLEAACERALAAGDPSYRTVKGILAAGLESAPLPSTADGSRLPALLRGPQELVGDLPNLNHPAHHGEQDLVEQGGR